MSNKLTNSDIEDIIALVEGSSFDHLSLEMGDLKLSLQRSGASSFAPVAASAAEGPVPVPAQAKPTVEPLPNAPQTESLPVKGEGLTDVTSEMLGTFYHASKPGADPLVSIGTNVTPDTVIGIIEVMKLMTSVPAGISGTVVEIVAPDGELVEYGQVLIRVQRD